MQSLPCISPTSTRRCTALHNHHSFLICAAVTSNSTAAPLGQLAFTERDFRNALGQFATGVTVVTTLSPEGLPVGMTVSSFNSVSLDPPLVLWSLGNHVGSYPVFAACRHYVVHVLSAQQQALAMQFARSGVDRFAGVAWTPNAQGIPVISDCLAHFECVVHSRHSAGDHLVQIGEVLACAHRTDAAPLLYHAGQMRS